MDQKNSFLYSLLQYSTLLLIASVIAIFFQKTADNLHRFWLVVLFGLVYIAWGYWHHGSYDRLDKLVIIEYSLVSLIMILLSALGLGIIRFF